MHKLLLIFDDDCEVNDVDKYLLFNNELDAKAYLESKSLSSVDIDLERKSFSFKAIAWKGTGAAIYIKQF